MQPLGFSSTAKRQLSTPEYHKSLVPALGTYDQELSWNKQSFRKRATTGPKKPVVSVAKSRPSIPLQKYKPSKAAKKVKTSHLLTTKRTTEFGKFKTQRILPFVRKEATSVVGPGHYNPGSKSSVNNPGGVVFQSKVPRLKEPNRESEVAPGPGFYQTDLNQSTYQGGYNIYQPKKECFGSTQQRDGLFRDPNLPFKDTTVADNPGPGTYHQPNGKERNNIKSSLREEPVAFGATSHRPCLNPKVDKTFAPGPGTYSSLKPQFARRRGVADGRGVFGAGSRRFIVKSQEIISQTEPGPGTYNWSPIQSPQASETVFKSRQDRFMADEYEQPGVGDHYVPPKWGNSKGAATAFRFTAPRQDPFIPSKATTKAPGPGQYSIINSQSKVPRAPSQTSSKFSTQSLRFRQKGDTNSYINVASGLSDVGPGSYNTSGMGVKTFNVKLQKYKDVKRNPRIMKGKAFRTGSLPAGTLAVEGSKRSPRSVNDSAESTTDLRTAITPTTNVIVQHTEQSTD